MLVRDIGTNQIKLAAIFIDPWKCILKEKEFDVPENVFFAKNSDIIMPVGKNCINMYSHDKIKSVFIMPSKSMKLATLIVQFWHSIYNLSISGSTTRRLTEPNMMIPEHMV